MIYDTHTHTHRESCCIDIYTEHYILFSRNKHYYSFISCCTSPSTHLSNSSSGFLRKVILIRSKLKYLLCWWYKIYYSFFISSAALNKLMYLEEEESRETENNELNFSYFQFDWFSYVLINLSCSILVHCSSFGFASNIIFKYFEGPSSLPLLKVLENKLNHLIDCFFKAHKSSLEHTTHRLYPNYYSHPRCRMRKRKKLAAFYEKSENLVFIGLAKSWMWTRLFFR